MDDFITFRTAIPSDTEAITEVYLISRKTFLPYAKLAHSDKEVYQWIRDILIPTSHVTVAHDRSRLLGMMATSTNANHSWIDQLYLHPLYTGQGIGSHFVKRAKAELGSVIRLFTFQENTLACRFYEQHGFKAMVFGNGSDNEEGCPDILYEFCPPNHHPPSP